MFPRRTTHLLMIAFVIAALMASGFPGKAVAAGSITVTSSADNTTVDGLCTLREAITNADSDSATFADCSTGSGNDTILFDNALGTSTIILNAALPTITDTNGLTVNGGGDITVSGTNLYQVFNIFPAGALNLQNLTIKNGKNNTGGGIQNINGALTITNSILDHNTSTIHGGGIYNTGTATITNSTFSGNSAASSGGAVISDDGSMTILNSTFINNSAASGGAIINGSTSTLTITNSTFVDNTSTNYGGAIYSTGTTTITNSTFSSNGAGISGSSIYYITFSTPILSLDNNILANSDTNIANCALISGTLVGHNNLIEDAIDGCGLTQGVNGNIIGLDPKLGPLANNGGPTQTMTLGIGSPAIDSGSGTACPLTDQRGVGRPQGAGCDMGAFESPVPTPTFNDVSIDYWAWQFIERLYNAGVTGGCSTNPMMYCPTVTVTRDQMAIFLLRGEHGGSYTPPTATGTMFADVPSTYWAAAWIEQLASEGITGGCGNGNYCPTLPVTRDQMAVFLLRGEHGGSYTPPAATGTMFADVPATHWAADWIEQLANEGITGGCGGGNYCPSVAATRDQMAVFLVRAFSLP